MSFEESNFYAFRLKEVLTKLCGFFHVIPDTRKYIDVATFFILRKVTRDRAGFDKLDHGVSGGNGIIVPEMRYKRLAITLHVDDIVAKLHDEIPDMRLRGDFFEATIVQIEH